MERVVDSVQQIIAECTDMLTHTENCEYLDVKGLATTLKDECDKLSTVYENTPDDTRALLAQKQVVERTAIRLEFFMSCRLGLYKDRQDLRKTAGMLYTDSKDLIMFLYRKGVDDNTLIRWTTQTNWALKFYGRSLHIIFSTDEDDEEQVKKIVEDMKQTKEKQGWIGV